MSEDTSNQLAVTEPSAVDAPSDRAAPTMPRLAFGPNAYLLASLVGTWLLIALPAILLLSLVLLVIWFMLTAATLGNTGGLEQDTFVSSLWLAGLALAVVLALRVLGGIASWRRKVALKTGAPNGRSRPGFLIANAGCGCTTALVFVLAVVALLAIPAEWGGNPWLPDLLSAVPVLTLFLLLTVLLPLEMVWRSIKLTAKVYGLVQRTPFVAGMVAGACTLVLLPALPLAYLSLEEDQDDTTTVASISYQEPVATFDMVEDLRTTMLETAQDFAEEGQGSNNEDAVKQCMDDLYQAPWGGLSDFEKARIHIQQSFRISQEDSEDAAMKALINVCTSESLNRFDNLAAVFTTAVQNEARNVLRRRVGLPIDEVVLVCLPFFNDDTRLTTEILAARAALRELDVTTQEAITMWAQGYTHREIGAQFGWTERQSRDKVYNGINKMRRAVAKTCFY